jgi:DNA helicase IV
LNALTNSDLEGKSVFEAMKDQRNIIRRMGRKIDGKCIGTTLLTKGLEFDTVAVLDADKFDNPKHLYVALTRCCKRLIIFTSKNILSPYS